MMELLDTINAIAKSSEDILLLIIPGYAAIRTSEVYGQKAFDEGNIKLISAVLYSFLIRCMYEIFHYLVNLIYATNGTIWDTSIMRTIVCIILGYLFGICLYKIPNHKIGRFLTKHILDVHTSPEPSVWYRAMTVGENGAWADVYLSNGMIYRGQLRYYSKYLREEKALILYRFSMRRMIDDNKGGYSYRMIVDYSSEEKIKEYEEYHVYLSTKDIVSIEILENPKDKEVEKKGKQKRIMK